MTQNNLGNALWALGKLESGTVRLKEAIEAYHEALKEHTRSRVPLQWAMIQNNLGAALAMLGERTGDVLKVKEARTAIDAAFDVFMQAGQEHHRASFERRLSAIDRIMADLTEPPGT